MLHTLFYPHEILKPQGLQLPQEEPSRKELQLAVELLKGYRMAFRPEGWKDAYREALMGLIQAKIQGREVKVAPVAERAKVVSLMEALKKSLQEAPRRRARAK
jgi:DNA end-binding protein Ku